MEIELKYGIPDKAAADMIWEDDYLKNMEEPDSREIVQMKAAYFDTDDYSLSRSRIAFRVRSEGRRTVATLKCKGKTEGALHTREEINVPLSGDDCLIAPGTDIFRHSTLGEELESLVAGRPLASIMDVVFTRRRFRIDTGTTIMEVSIDQGEIIADRGTLPICEVEIELFSGEQDELLGVGAILAEKYGLEAEIRSKYARGLSLTDMPAAEA